MQKKRRTDHSPVRRFFGYTYSIDLQVFFSSDVPTYDFVCQGFTRRFDNLMYVQSHVQTISCTNNLISDQSYVQRAHSSPGPAPPDSSDMVEHSPAGHPVCWNTIQRGTWPAEILSDRRLPFIIC